MRRLALWVGIGAAIVAYLAWTVTHVSTTPSDTTPLVISAASPSATSTPRPGTPTPLLATATPTPAAAPTLLLNAGRVTRQSVVVAAGFGFAPGEKLRLIRQNPYGQPATVVTARADQHGEFSGLLIHVADTWPNGKETISIEGLTSHHRATAHFDLEGSPPGAAPTTYAGKPLSKVSFSGGGFSPREEVDVYFDTLASPVIARFTADKIGVVHASGVVVPISAAGQHAFLLLGKSSRAPVRVPFSVLAFSPWIGLSSYTPQPEQSIGVVGHDFAPGERVAVFLDTDRGRPLSQATADPTGVFRLDSALIVPYDRRGKFPVVAVGTLSQITVTATLNVLPFTPTIELSRYAGPPGTAFTVKGRGFARNEDVQVQVGGQQQALAFTFHTDAEGKLANVGAIQIPKNMPSGKLPVTADGNHSQAPAAVTFAVTPLNPWFGPVPAAGPAGARVSFDGGGFAPDEPVQVAISSDAGTSPATTFTTDDGGGIHHAGSLLIPTALSGRVTLVATGVQSGARASTTYTALPGPPRGRTG